MEIGGYIELEKSNKKMLYADKILLNAGRNCLKYIIKAKNIQKIYLPYFLCDSVRDACKDEYINIAYYHISDNFLPKSIELQHDEWIYVVNYYGQLSNQKLEELHNEFSGRMIVDNAQAYFQEPVIGIDTLYTCRKFFGVADGAILSTSQLMTSELSKDESFQHMNFLLGRFERSASEFYGEYAENNKRFKNEPIKKMSELTKNLLNGIDYEFVKEARTTNFNYLHQQLKDINLLTVTKVEGAFAYPLMIENAAEIRKQLIAKKIYIPLLWPNVLDDVEEDSLEYQLALNILPLPCDQRYGVKEMDIIVSEIMNQLRL
ncbi:hypothetical protein SAMN05421767_11235 [Granulicatella balaenopterae]|uniref:dTDP-4-amino-4,6-dideoxygalactose transaminase n=1 Tax=Granulicatella balaenopterae TaxID=137733 RepID=A0A1H9KA61_9LACT|nr:hypothetical protein [Granulicatella balaenopterae]SEQ95817.1 hypothetical protein SAMN05421767_11235 [Granulicatella balaenopterae]